MKTTSNSTEVPGPDQTDEYESVEAVQQAEKQVQKSLTRLKFWAICVVAIGAGSLIKIGMRMFPLILLASLLVFIFSGLRRKIADIDR